MEYPPLWIVQDMPPGLARILYRDLPDPKTDEEKDVMEKLAIIVQACELTDMEGNLIEGAVAK